MTIREVDFQDMAKRDDTFNQLLVINEQLDKLSVYPGLVWVFTFDIIKDIYEECQFIEGDPWQEEVISAGTDLKVIFDKFWEDCDMLGFSFDLGGEIIEETLRDWMRENNFLVALDDDGWLNDENV